MRILLADDHSLVRDALKPWLEGLAETVDILEAGTLPEALAHVGNGEQPELILLDLHMPGMNGPSSIGAVRAAFPKSAVVILSGFATPIANMPEAVQLITLIDPLRYFLVILRKVFLEGAGFDVLTDQLWPMAVIGVVTLGLASWLFRHRMY